MDGWMKTMQLDTEDQRPIRREKPHRAKGEEHGRHVLTEAKVRLIRESHESCHALAEKFAVTPKTIWRARRGINWGHVQP